MASPLKVYAPELFEVAVLLVAPLRVTVTPDIAGAIVPEMLQVAGGVTPRAKVWDAPLYVAVRVAVIGLDTDATVAVNVAVVAPAATVALAGTVTLALLLDNATTDPPVDAAALRVTVQAAEPGAVTLDGLHESPVSDG